MGGDVEQRQGLLSYSRREASGTYTRKGCGGKEKEGEKVCMRRACPATGHSEERSLGLKGF